MRYEKLLKNQQIIKHDLENQEFRNRWSTVHQTATNLVVSFYCTIHPHVCEHKQRYELAKYSRLSLVLHLQIFLLQLITVCLEASSSDRFKIKPALAVHYFPLKPFASILYFLIRIL